MIDQLMSHELSMSCFGMLNEDIHFLNCISTYINIFIFLSSALQYKPEKKKKTTKCSNGYINATIQTVVVPSGHALA